MKNPSAMKRSSSSKTRHKRRSSHSSLHWVAALGGAGAVVFAASTVFSREPVAHGPGLNRSPREMSGKVDPVPVPVPPELRLQLAPDAAPAAPQPVLQRAVYLPAAMQTAALGGAEAGAPDAAEAGPLAVALPPRGARPRREQQRFVYMASSKRLSDVLRDFSASQSLPAVLADGIDGVVNGNFDATPREFLDAVAQAYGILWYHDGAAYYFYPARSIQSRMFRLKGYTREQLVDLLASFGLGDARYPIRYNAAQQTVMVYGPPRHVELVARALETLDLGAAEGNEPVVKVFRLRYAAAGDRMMGDMRMPGVVATLRGLYARGPAGGEEGAPAVPATLLNKIKAVQPTGDVRKAAETVVAPGTPPGAAGAAAEPQAGGESPRGLRSPVNFEDDRPMFEADEASNSVVVQGRAHRMREYEALIRRLDQKPLLLELEATIIDVTADNVRLLGIDWAAQNNRAAVSVVQPQQSAPQTPAGALVDGASFSVSTVVAGAGRELLARVNALQGEGKARIQSKPSILGVANRPAVMKEKRIATVRVAGNLDVKVFQVEAGTLLQVTPQVTLAPDGTPQIKLQLYIEDGNFESNQVDQVPVVKKTEIRTEAHVKEGESLLIGGLVVDGDVQLQTGVPGLSRLPLVGALFRSTSSRATRVERLFMITPRVVPDNAAGEPQVGSAAGPSSVAVAAREAQMDALVNQLTAR
jgi:type III secretion protein C